MGQLRDSFPRQKISDLKKTKEWYKKNINAVDNSGFFESEGIRNTYKNRIINQNLYNGILDKNDIVSMINPNGVVGDTIPDTMQHYPIAVPRLDVLIGEEVKRRFDFKIVVTNPDAISSKETEKLNILKAGITSFLENNYEEDALKKKLAELDQYVNHEWQDLKEITANRLLNHLYQDLKLHRVFNDGFKDVLVQGEEYYIADIISGEPLLSKLNPHSVHFLRSGFSNRIEDADLIVIDEYWSPGRIIDTYYDRLSSKDIDKIETGFDQGGTGPFTDKSTQPLFALADSSEDARIIDELVNISVQGSTLNRASDMHGNIRVMRVFWRSFRKIKKVKYFDEQGDEQFDFFPDKYKVKEDEGESAETMWINEWLEGTQIGKDLYIDLRPRQIQYHTLNNPSYCHPGITGRAYSTNQSRVVSLMDRLKNYQYLYDIIFDRLLKDIAKDHGKALILDVAVIPDGWDIEQWMHYLKTMGIAVKDSFKEGNKGAATGKLAGNLGRGGDHSVLDMETGASIQQNISLLDFIKNEMTEISGVSQQRLGQIENRETIGGVERAVTQSSHITEWYFSVHDDVKLEALKLLLNTAKIAYKGQNKKIQYILDDQSIQMLNLDGDDFSESEYGLIVTNNSKSNEVEQTLKTLAQAALQRGEVNMSTLIDIFMSNSISDMRRKLQKAEQAAQKAQAEQADEANKLVEQQQQIALELEKAKLELEERNNIRDNETRLLIKDADNALSEDEDDDDNLNLEKFNLESQKRLDDLSKFNDTLEFSKKQHSDKMRLESKKLNKATIAKK